MSNKKGESTRFGHDCGSKTRLYILKLYLRINTKIFYTKITL